jgi:two-component system sensor histidine kinase CpxA
MRSLFFKIFGWFWLAMLVVTVALFFAFALIRPAPSTRAWRDFPLLGQTAQKAAETYDREGQQGLAAYLDAFETSNGIESILLSDQAAELSGRPIPAGWQDLAWRDAAARAIKSARAPDTTQYSVSSTSLLVAQQVSTQGHKYVYVSRLPRTPLAFNWRALALRLIVVSLIGGVLCYGLARYLTTPINKLQGTTHEFADGNLAARVSPPLVKRHDEIGQLGRDFNQMAERLEAMVAAQHRLLGDISHELRSPLARMNVALELARKRAGAEARSALDRIERESEMLNEMIGHLLTLTRLESGTRGLQTSDVDLAHLVREVAEDADYEAQSRNRSVQVVTCDECSTVGTEELLRSAIENVIRNAVRYTAEGTPVEITLQVANGASGQLNGTALINVRDHGDGVPDEAMEKIFRPFYRTEDARDRESGGTGLGLAITSRAVRLHGGTVRAANADGGGLQVTINLPISHNGH